MGFSATAQAQTDVLSATLTVKDLGTSQVGCANTTPSARCSDFLSEDEFTYDSTDYAVTDLFVRPSGSLVLGFNADLTTAAQTLTLDVAGTTFAFEDAETKTTAVRIWSNSGLSWSVDDPVVVKLVEPAPTVPGAPVLTATANGETQIDLSWTVPDTGGRALDKYSIDVSADGGTTWGPQADVGSAITTYSHTGLTGGTTRHYRVAAVNPIGTGAWSNVDSATTEAVVANNPATGNPFIIGMPTPQVGQSLSASLGSVADADGPSIIVASYQWIRVDGATETDITGATITPYMPVADDVGKQLKVRLSFTDDLGNPESRTSAATDADGGDTLRYTLGGTDMASFAIVSTSGQLQTQAALDFETKSSYAVTVSVSDGNGGSDSIGVTITVTDVNEQPGRPAAPSVGATANSDTSLDVSWTAPGLNGGPAITGYNLRYRQGTSGSFTNGPQNVSGTSAMITGLTAGTSYQVQVRALNGETPSDWSPAGTGSSSTPAQPTLTLDVDPNRFSEDAGTVTICVVPSAVSSQRITVQVATADGTATAPDDYVSHSGTVALQPQQQRACFTVTLVDDADAEGDETFTVTLSNPVNATLGGARAVATFTIVDNDDTTVATDRAALVAFYNATGGANWTFNTNWLSNEPLSEWRGVTTNDDGRVTELDLRNNQLTGEIPEELAQLPQLRELALWGNQLTGTIPPEVAPAQDRAVLRVFYNATGGANWADNTAWLSNAPLSAWHGVITDANGRVTNLSLSANGLTGTIPPELENLDQLQVFDIRNTGLCVTAGSELHTWLATINFQGSVCGTRTPPGGGGGGGGTGGGGSRKTAPSAPRNLEADGGNEQVALSWDAPENDGGFAITDYEYRIDRRNPWISIGSTNTTHTVTGLVNGTVYVFEVRAVNAAGNSAYSNRAEATPGAGSLDFAHFANGDGITSDLVFVNVAPHPIRPALYFYAKEGQRIAAESVVEITGDLEIQEDGGLTVRTEMEPLGELTISTHGRGEVVTGSVKVVSDGPIGGVLRFDLPGIGVAGVGASQPVRDAIFPARRLAEGIRTGMAIRNLGEEAMEVTCRLMSGGTVLEEVEIPLEANGQEARFIAEVFTAPDTSDFVGLVRCAAPSLFTGLAIEMDAANRIFTTLPVVPVNRGGGGRAAVLDFAHFANGDSMSSDLVFVNVGTQPSGPAPTPFHTAIPPIRPAIYFYDKEGHLIAAESVVEITGDLEIQEDGGLTVRTEMEPLGELTVSTHGRGPLVSGSVKVLSDGPIGGVLRFDLPDIGVAGVGASSPVSDAIFPVRRWEGGINTGVAIHNLESSPGLVRCELMREGVLRDAVPIPLAANGQVSWFIDEMFPATDTSDFVGSVRCTVPDGGSFAGVAVELDAANRIFTTLPVVPVPERTPQE